MGAEAKPSGRFFAGNTNLEEISDWITKIIVGLSLVQAERIYVAIGAGATKFAKDGLVHNGAEVIFVIMLIAGFIGGFMFFYLETRTRVTLLLGELERLNEFSSLPKDTVKTVLKTAIIAAESEDLVGGVRSVRAKDPAPTDDDKKIIAVPYESLRTPEQLAAWGAAQARNNNIALAKKALLAAIDKDPDNTEWISILSKIQQRDGNLVASAATVSAARGIVGDDPRILRREVLLSLYQDPPASFEKAIPIAQQLLAMDSEKHDPFVHLWYAAARGQQYNSFADKTVPEAVHARAEALEAVKRVMDLTKPDSPARTAMMQIFDPALAKSDPEDNDLEVFNDDADFQQAISGSRG